MSFFSNKKVKKVMLDNDFMAALENSKKIVQSNLETNSFSYDESLEKSIKILEEFSNTKNPSTLKEVGKGFIFLISKKPNKVAAYVYMAYVLYLFDLKEDAFKYIESAEQIDPNYKYIKEVKSFIFS